MLVDPLYYACYTCILCSYITNCGAGKTGLCNFCFYKLRKNILFNSTKDCIIEALANPEKERMKHDDTTISSWLQS